MSHEDLGEAASLLELVGITKQFGSGREAKVVVRDVSLALYPGEVLWLQGESGAGKSSLLRVASAMSTPTQGTVRIGGREVARRRSATIRRSEIGMIFQNGNLIPDLTLRDNVAIAGKTPDYKRVDQLLDQFGLATDAQTLGKEASGGQAQRCAVCRALLNDPSIILADEPTASLDSGNSRAVMTHLSGLADSGRGVIVAAHDERFAQIATRTIRMVGGELV